MYLKDEENSNQIPKELQSLPHTVSDAGSKVDFLRLEIPELSFRTRIFQNHTERAKVVRAEGARQLQDEQVLQ